MSVEFALMMFPALLVLLFFGFPVALKTVTHVPKQLSDFTVADGMTTLVQLGRQGARALTRPSQGRLRMTTGEWFDQ